MIINASTLFSGIWSVIKTFIDKVTLERIQVYKKDYEKPLKELIDES